MSPPDRFAGSAEHAPGRRLVHAAAELFAAQGYATTSVRQIAQQAHVSLDTVYARGGKAEIFLLALELVLSGTADGTPLLQVEGMEEVWAAETLEQVVGGLVAATVGSNDRSAAMWSAFVEGASSERVLASAMREKHAAMREEGRKAIDFLKARGLCAPGVDTHRVADLIWTAAHPHRYALLVGSAGWTIDEFSTDLTTTVLWLLRDR